MNLLYRDSYRQKLRFQAVIKSAASAASLRTKIGESGSEKKMCTFLRSKVKITQSTFPMRPNGQTRPIPRDPATLGKIKKIYGLLSFFVVYIKIPIGWEHVHF